MPTRVFTVPDFDRFAHKARIDDAALVEVVERAERGIVDADLGGGLVKLRVARPGQGRSGGFRTLVALVVDRRAVFLYGFAKNDASNVRDDAERTFRLAGNGFLQMGERSLEELVAVGKLREIER